MVGPVKALQRFVFLVRRSVLLVVFSGWGVEDSGRTWVAGRRFDQPDMRGLVTA